VSHKIKSIKGFTLLEIMIGMTLFAFISVFTTTAIQSNLADKKRIERRIDTENEVRTALQLIIEDFRRAFNYRDINVQLYNLAQLQRRKNAEQRQKDALKTPPPGAQTPPASSSPPPPKAPIDLEKEYPLKQETILTHFKGVKDQVSFTTLNFLESANDVPESDQAEVSYEVKECTNPITKKQSKCLIRRSSNFIDDELEEGGNKSLLVENVSRLEIRYLGTEHSTETKELEWLDEWDSEEGDEALRNKFPDAVEVTLETTPIEDNKDYKVAITMMTSVWGSNVTTKFEVKKTTQSEDPVTPNGTGGTSGTGDTGTSGGTGGGSSGS